jgi:hypothetical protein
VAWALLLAIGWLLPNHYPPWWTFHMDAWVACAGMLAASVIFLRAPRTTGWPPVAWVALGLSLVPGLQYGFGLVTSSGNAWVSTAFMLGFVLALLTGVRWERMRAGHLADCLFFAIGLAAILSVGLQLHQWLQLDRLDIWTIADGNGRPFANFAQPNQLATFLLWGVLALAWGVVRGRIGTAVAIAAALFLLFGLALTASRTAWIALVLFVLAAWWWRSLWPNPRTPWAVMVLVLWFVACMPSIRWLGELLLLRSGPDPGDVLRMSTELRPMAWALFLDAVSQQPWWGYGWNQVGAAQMALAVDHPAPHVFFSHAHNLFLDLLLWCGIPIGATAGVLICWWFLRCIRRIAHAEDAILMLFLLVVMNHAMLELPLHHAYMLIPTGLVIGALDVRLGRSRVVNTGRAAVWCVWLACLVFLTLIIRDYSRVEQSYQTLRFEWARIKTAPAQAPDVVLLTQWTDYFRLVRAEPVVGMSEAELQWMRDATVLNPNAGFYRFLAISLAMNDRPQEAALWMRRLCQIATVGLCARVKMAWKQEATQNPTMATVPWPD